MRTKRGTQSQGKLRSNNQTQVKLNTTEGPCAVICAILISFISDKITLMKSYYPGIWYQEESDMTNVNIFRNKIT